MCWDIERESNRADSTILGFIRLGIRDAIDFRLLLPNRGSLQGLTMDTGNSPYVQKTLDIHHWRKLYCLCHIFCYSVNVYIYWFICCVLWLLVVQVQRVLVYFFDFLKERSCPFHCPFISSPFLHHLWLGVSICEVFKPEICNIFLSLFLFLVSLLVILICRSSDIIKAHSLISCVLSMLSCCDNTEVCILTTTHVYIGCIYVYTCAIHAIWAIYYCDY